MHRPWDRLDGRMNVCVCVGGGRDFDQEAASLRIGREYEQGTLISHSSVLTADPALPGEAHDDSVAQTLGHIPAHPTTLVEKQGVGTASVCGEDGLVGVGLEVSERQMETSMRGLEVPPWCPHTLVPHTPARHRPVTCPWSPWAELCCDQSISYLECQST